MATRKATVKRKAQRDLKRATTPVEAREIINELKEEIEPKAESFPKGKVPGITIGGTKVGYNYQDLCKMFPIVSFTPDETIPLNFQGVRVQAISGIEMHVPKCFKNIYDEHRRRLRETGAKLPENTGYFNLVELGAGGLPLEKE